jgi:hypothetical protein
LSRLPQQSGLLWPLQPHSERMKWVRLKEAIRLFGAD